MSTPTLPPNAVPGAEYAPLVPGGLEIVWQWSRYVSARHRVVTEDQPGPHLEAHGDTQRYRVADLTDGDTALLVLRRMLALRQAPVRASALGLVALSGRWATTHATQLGELCRRVWGPHQPQEP